MGKDIECVISRTPHFPDATIAPPASAAAHATTLFASVVVRTWHRGLGSSPTRCQCSISILGSAYIKLELLVMRLLCTCETLAPSRRGATISLSKLHAFNSAQFSVSLCIVDVTCG